MPAPVTWDDLKVFDPDIEEPVANAMIASVWARAVKLAPCLKTKEWSETDTDDAYEDTQFVKDILRRTILRWSDSGSGAVTQRSAGEYGESLSEYSGGLFRPDEVRDLQNLCAESAHAQKATTILTDPTAGTWEIVHADWCSMSTLFGGNICECGAELSNDGRPLWVHP